jgi:hypothetical protein
MTEGPRDEPLGLLFQPLLYPTTFSFRGWVQGSLTDMPCSR